MKNLLKTIFFSSCLISSHLAMASLFMRPVKHAATTIVAITYTHKVISGEEKDFTKLPDFSLAEVRDYSKNCKTTFTNTCDSLQGNVKSASSSIVAKFKANQNESQKSFEIKKEDHHNMSPEEIPTHNVITTAKHLEEDYSNQKSPEDDSHDPETPNMD